ncbi:putative NADH-dependent butanol dehydrogenase a [Monocercomonoides exilis]|uniref:putative NADH-dependent butanol dehydrogenase a n=1 Tax=Monocercomonoides exilis TaxID=2049356 RepID=UPI00355A724D|nr:putative NADH-dependent butanol dehydrogenase a [Monocercomonoides exilis]|eukprot:MONOS_1599.1-p1 / transcript=MONOS_1599.1 / gene=MONOS_1599 / organism=Monocercomonoides_exilis_PA203 / gene_product=NADH-dependent butanol dehydrogenase a / transcript_product=NADH-dependent butanol dehydrogenase a / location=Mono_scaffold00029:16091-17331(+) / protein_length=392 / sequence_SO=supercontig / SO=protein_coding / is_pseudo=false
MSLLTFYAPTKIIFGPSSIEQLGSEILDQGIHKVLIVLGGGSAKENGVYERVIKTLNENKIGSIELWGVKPDPVIAKVREGVSLCKNYSLNIDGVVAVGGGSVLDSAKAICAGAKMEKDVWEVFLGKEQAPTQNLPLFAVLTVSNSASEFNPGAVMSDPDGLAKMEANFAHPVISAIDPSVQFHVPKRKVVSTATNAFSHLMESYLSVDNKNITTRQINLALQKSLFSSVDRILKNPEDLAARSDFCWVISLSVCGITSFGLSGDWNVHFIERAVETFDSKVVHGEGIGVLTLAYYPWLYKQGMCKEMFAEWAETVFGVADVEKALDNLRTTFTRWGAPVSLQDIGIKLEDVESIAKLELQNRAVFGTSPLKKLTEEEIIHILRIACGVDEI